MDDEEYDEAEMAAMVADPLPLTWADFLIPAVRVFRGAFEGAFQGMKYMDAALVQHSLNLAERKIDKRAQARDKAAMLETQKDIDRLLTASDMEARDD